MKVKNAGLHTSCPKVSQLPDTDWPEFAFLGRSNVGKSSLLNALVRRKNLAHTSSTPGKTRMIHFFEVATDVEPLLLVDLPGYGFARVSRQERNAWRGLVEGYLEGRKQLRAAILLQDVRRDFSEDETLLLDWLTQRKISAVVAITKVVSANASTVVSNNRASSSKRPAPLAIATAFWLGQPSRGSTIRM